VTDTPARRRWRIIDVAKKEFAELPKAGKQGLTELMARVRRGDDVLPREVGHYGNGLKGLKYSEGHNEFRAYYSPEGEEGQVLVAVQFIQKKTESAQLGVAIQRINDHRKEHERTKREREREQKGR
jgi:hypothetical protein